ncbi:MAG: zinc ribbon domain-containing protein [Syntrophobacterales bacterium]|nr:zinc ribbon domain-containing protein [Syntrophobacterales bacterium]
MPIYEYECASCGKIIEAVQKFSDAPLTQCASCGGALRKLISLSTFHLKGTGWYVTDYAHKSQGYSPSKSKDSSSVANDTSSSSKNSSED